MKASDIVLTGASILTAAMLFAGCAGITHEPKVDMSALPVVDDAAFLNALNSIGIEEADVRTMADTSFSFSDNDTDYKVVINLDATSEKNNQFSYSQCADEKTARELFDYYYDNYDHLFDAEEFSGISSHEIGSDSAYVLIDGRCDNNTTNTYTPYHDAIFLKGDTVMVVVASDYDIITEKEINDFLKALGYPHP
jgi:hypothetical protein